MKLQLAVSKCFVIAWHHRDVLISSSSSLSSSSSSSSAAAAAAAKTVWRRCQSCCLRLAALRSFSASYEQRQTDRQTDKQTGTHRQVDINAQTLRTLNDIGDSDYLTVLSISFGDTSWNAYSQLESWRPPIQVWGPYNRGSGGKAPSGVQGQSPWSVGQGGFPWSWHTFGFWTFTDSRKFVHF